jgi:hypothetical protein
MILFPFQHPPNVILNELKDLAGRSADVGRSQEDARGRSQRRQILR